MRRFYFALCAMAVIGTAAVHALDDKKPAETKKAEKSEEAKRFDLIVREDIFAGFNGDADALKRGLEACDAELKKNHKSAEAMVWRGAGRVFEAGQLFGAGKSKDALPIWTGGLKDLDEAVKLEPNNVGVRIPRAAVLVQAGRNAPAAIGKPLLEKARDDFETIAKLQAKELEKLGVHPRGELHMGLADIYRLLGEKEKSKEQLEAVEKALPDTKYSKRAKEWLAAKADAKLEHSCIGCHRPDAK
jgi:tetratricopeptide (TPR) repeat protein